MKHYILIILALIILISSSCANIQSPKFYPNRTGHSNWTTAALYLPNRILDFIDIFRINVGIGPGIGIAVRPTKFAQLGIATYQSVKIGPIGRRGWIYIEDTKEFEASLIYVEKTETVGPLFFGEENSDRRLFEIAASAWLFFAGAEVGIRPVELGDFFTGLFLYDLKEDDF